MNVRVAGSIHTLGWREIVFIGMLLGLILVFTFSIYRSVSSPPKTLQEAAQGGMGSYQARCLLYLKRNGLQGEYDQGGMYRTPTCKAVVEGKILNLPKVEWNSIPE